MDFEDDALVADRFGGVPGHLSLESLDLFGHDLVLLVLGFDELAQLAGQLPVCSGVDEHEPDDQSAIEEEDGELELFRKQNGRMQS